MAMINAAIVEHSCSALGLAKHIEKACGLTGKEFMQIVMNQWDEMGVPGAKGMFEQQQQCAVPESSPIFAAMTQDFGPANGR